MASEEFKTGDLVWARMKGFPPWPAKVVDPPPNQKAPKYKKAHYVYFFGSQNYAWILDDRMLHLKERGFDNLAKKKSAVYQKAVDELINESRSLTKDKQCLPKIKKEKTQPEEEKKETKFGFIGLGDMGDAIVSNLLVSGHNVTVWNKNSVKCQKYIAMGAKQVRYPADLITECDITFCCVSDKEASKALIFGDRGILKGLEMSEQKGQEPKGYVEMTSIDPETSITINEAINMKHGVYLEAPFRGSIRQAQKGELLFVASGDRDLFAKCETCFHCFSKYAYYLTCDVGQASKVALLLSYMSDSMCVLVAEALVLGDRLEVKKADFLKIIRNHKGDPGIFGYKNLIEIFHLMSTRGIDVLVTQKHVHKDIKLALDMADQFSQSMPLTSQVNEVFIRAKRQAQVKKALNEKHSE